MAVQYLLVAIAAAVVSPAAASVSSSNDLQGLETDPKPVLLIHFPKTTEIGCFDGEKPPPRSKGVFFQLDRVLGHEYTCKFLTYNMHDYEGNTDAYRFRRLVTMYPDIVKPDYKLQCDSSSEEFEGSEFEILEDGVKKLCHMVAEVASRANVPRLELKEGYKRLPGGLLMLRAWYDLPARGRYSRSPQLSRAEEAARRHDSAAAAAARLIAEAQKRKLNGGRG